MNSRGHARRVGEEDAIMNRSTPPLGVKIPNNALEFTDDASLVIVILGASGDLAKRKTYPALCTLHAKKFLPQNCKILGYARSELTNESHKVIP